MKFSPSTAEIRQAIKPHSLHIITPPCRSEQGSCYCSFPMREGYFNSDSIEIHIRGCVALNLLKLRLECCTESFAGAADSPVRVPVPRVRWSDWGSEERMLRGRHRLHGPPQWSRPRKTRRAVWKQRIVRATRRLDRSNNPQCGSCSRRWRQLHG